MHAACCSLHTLQLDCAFSASWAAREPASTSNVIANTLMIGFPLSMVVRTLDLRARRLVERSAQSLGKPHGIVDGPKMQEEQPRLLVQHVAMDRCHVDAVRS